MLVAVTIILTWSTLWILPGLVLVFFAVLPSIKQASQETAIERKLIGLVLIASTAAGAYACFLRA